MPIEELVYEGIRHIPLDIEDLERYVLENCKKVYTSIKTYNQRGEEVTTTNYDFEDFRVTKMSSIDGVVFKLEGKDPKILSEERLHFDKIAHGQEYWD